MGLYEDFSSALEKAKNERELSHFLKNNIILIKRLRHSWNDCALKAEFKIGPFYIADFVVLSARSGAWECLLVEMQSHLDLIYTKSNEATEGLREAERQISDWKMYIEENESAFRDQLSILAEENDMPACCSRADVHQCASSELRDPHIYIEYRYMILIGRREYLSLKNNKRRSMRTDCEIVTFDRLLEDAKRIDSNTAKIVE